MTHERSGARVGTRRIRRGVAVIVLAESIVVIGYGFVLGIGTLVGHPTSRDGSAFLALLVVVLGAGLVAVARGVLRAQRWSRAPALVWQLLQAAVAGPSLQARPALGVPLLVVAALGAVGLFVPGVVDGGGPGGAAEDADR